ARGPPPLRARPPRRPTAGAERGSERAAPLDKPIAGLRFDAATAGLAFAVLRRLLLAWIEPGRLSPVRLARYKARRGDQPWPENRRDQEGIGRGTPRPRRRRRQASRPGPGRNARVAASPRSGCENPPRRAIPANASVRGACRGGARHAPRRARSHELLLPGAPLAMWGAGRVGRAVERPRSRAFRSPGSSARAIRKC